MSDDVSAPPMFPSFTETWHTTAYPAIDPTRPELSAVGKNIVITGGGSGIGAETSNSFAKAGASTISILGRREEVLLETKERIQGRYPGVGIHVYVVDVTNEDRVKAVFADIHSRVGNIDVYVNNAGYVEEPDRPIKSFPFNEWWYAFEVNVKGSFITTQAFLQYSAPNATIINVSTAAAHLSFGPIFSAYSSSKLAAVNFFFTVQRENPDLKVISIQPGIIDTYMCQKAGFPPMDDVSLPASLMVWLATPEAEFLKGKFIWSNWDIDEMKSRADEIKGSNLLTMDLAGWPFVTKP